MNQRIVKAEVSGCLLYFWQSNLPWRKAVELWWCSIIFWWRYGVQNDEIWGGKTIFPCDKAYVIKCSWNVSQAIEPSNSEPRSSIDNLNFPVLPEVCKVWGSFRICIRARERAVVAMACFDESWDTMWSTRGFWLVVFSVPLTGIYIN